MAGEIAAFLAARGTAPALPRDQLVLAAQRLAAMRRAAQQVLDDARDTRNADADLGARSQFEPEIQTLAALVRELDQAAKQVADVAPVVDQLAAVEAALRAALPVTP